VTLAFQPDVNEAGVSVPDHRFESPTHDDGISDNFSREKTHLVQVEETRGRCEGQPVEEGEHLTAEEILEWDGGHILVGDKFLGTINVTAFAAFGSSADPIGVLEINKIVSLREGCAKLLR